MRTDRPGTWEDTGTIIDLQIAVLRLHASHFGDWAPDDMVCQWGRDQPKEHAFEFAAKFESFKLD